MNNLIGIIGPAGSGKTTVAKLLTEYKRAAFADALKSRAAYAIGIDDVELEKNKQTLRPMLVEIGRMGRVFDPDIWVDIVMYGIDRNPGRYVIDDVRYINECQAILDRGGKLFYLMRDCVPFANEEEQRSIREILDNQTRLGITFIDNNGPPERAAGEIVEAMK